MTTWLLVLILSDGTGLTMELGSLEDCKRELKFINPRFGVCIGVDYENNAANIPRYQKIPIPNKDRQAGQKFSL